MWGARRLSGTGWEKRGDRRGGFGVGPSSDGGRVFGGGRGERHSGRGSRAGGRSRAVEPRGPTETFAVGDVVDHKAFGRGRVVEVNGDQLSVRFERTGETKKLLVGYAPIVKIKQ